MGKPIVPTADVIAKKWAEEGPRRQPYYEANTPLAGDRWQTNTVAAAETFKAAVGATDIAKRFAGGAKKAGSAKFVRKVTSVGVSRFGPGITAAQEDMKTGIDPYLPVMAATELGARKPRGDSANYDRVKKIGDPLHAKRLALLAAGPA